MSQYRKLHLQARTPTVLKYVSVVTYVNTVHPSSIFCTQYTVIVHITTIKIIMLLFYDAYTYVVTLISANKMSEMRIH